MTHNNQQDNQIISGVIWKQLLIFFFPIAVGSIFQQFYNTVDAVIVGRFVGKEALASVGGSAAMVCSLVLGFFTGMSAGATVIISQFYGAGDKKNLHKSLHTAYALCVVLGVVLMVVGWYASPWLLELMQTNPEIMDDSVTYLRIYFMGILGLLIYNMGSAIMRAVGDSRRPLYYLIVCCVINIVLDVVLVVVFEMGVAGVAVATAVAQLVSAVLVTRSLMYSYEGLKLELGEIRLDLAKLKVQLRIGMPSGLQAAMYGVSNIVIQAAVNSFGTDTVAAWAAYGKLDAIFWAICGAFGVAITTFAGQNYGAGKLDRVFKSLKICMGMAVVACGGIMLLLIVFCRPLFGIFCDDAAVVDIGVYMLTTMMPSYILFVFIEIFTGALRGLSDVVVPTVITMTGVLFVRVPMMIFVIPVIPDLMVILMSYPISWAATLILLLPYFYYRKRKICRAAQA
ncbi:MAG: MATE family efflux transporter [Clostridium sp.]|nr:MATE family efflux transporter [Clostridium sp.]